LAAAEAAAGAAVEVVAAEEAVAAVASYPRPCRHPYPLAEVAAPYLPEEVEGAAASPCPRAEEVEEG
jgi:hypothetical protein